MTQTITWAIIASHVSAQQPLLPQQLPPHRQMTRPQTLQEPCPAHPGLGLYLLRLVQQAAWTSLQPHQLSPCHHLPLLPSRHPAQSPNHIAPCLHLRRCCCRIRSQSSCPCQMQLLPAAPRAEGVEEAPPLQVVMVVRLLAVVVGLVPLLLAALAAVVGRMHPRGWEEMVALVVHRLLLIDCCQDPGLLMLNWKPVVAAAAAAALSLSCAQVTCKYSVGVARWLVMNASSRVLKPCVLPELSCIRT